MKQPPFSFLLLVWVFLPISSWGADLTTKLSTTDGSTTMSIQDSDGADVGTVTSDGDANFNSLQLTGNSNVFIKNQTTLQSGTTLYVSSGAVSPQINVSTLKFSDTSTTTIGATLRYVRVGRWGISNAAASLTNSQIFLEIGSAQQVAAGSRMKMPFDGVVVGICVTGSAVCTAGSATFQVFKNGSDIGSSSDAVINTTDTQFVCSTGGTGTFVAGDLLDIRLTTDAGFAPTGSTEYTADLLVKFTN